MLRILLAAPISAIITAAIFLGMWYLIRVDAPELQPAKQIPQIVITAQLPEPEPYPDDRSDPLPEQPEIPPIEAPKSGEPGDVEVPRAPKPAIDLPDISGRGDIIGVAIITIPPTYPERCKARGAEGVVIVEFDVNEIGDVVDARIIASDDPCFDRTVLRTIASWKFAPASRGGNPVVQRELRRAFRFELAE